MLEGARMIILSEDDPITSYSLARRSGLFQSRELKLYLTEEEEYIEEQIRYLSHELTSSQTPIEHLSDAILSMEAFKSYNKKTFGDVLSSHGVLVLPKSNEVKETLYKLLDGMDHDIILCLEDKEVNVMNPLLSYRQNETQKRYPRDPHKSFPKLIKNKRNIITMSPKSLINRRTSINIDVIYNSSPFEAIAELIHTIRLTYNNIWRSICVTLSSIIPSSLPFIISIVGAIPVSISHGLILVLNFIINIILVLGITHEEPNLSHRKEKEFSNIIEKDLFIDFEKRPKQHICNVLLLSYVWNGLLSTLMCFSSFLFVLWQEGMDMRKIPQGLYNNHIDPESVKMGVGSYFLTLVTMQITFCLLVKTRSLSLYLYPVFSNKIGLCSYVIVFGLALLCIYVSWSNSLFGTSQIPFVFCIGPLVLPFLVFHFDQLRKLIIRKSCSLKSKKDDSYIKHLSLVW